MLNFVYFLVSLHFLGKSAFFNTFHPARYQRFTPTNVERKILINGKNA